MCNEVCFELCVGGACCGPVLDDFDIAVFFTSEAAVVEDGTCTTQLFVANHTLCFGPGLGMFVAFDIFLEQHAASAAETVLLGDATFTMFASQIVVVFVGPCHLTMQSKLSVRMQSDCCDDKQV